MALIAQTTVGSGAGAALPPVESGGRPDLQSAWRSYWVAFLLYLGVGLGLSWDRAWHATHVFQNFFSPPHLFIYTMVFLTAVAVSRLALVPRLRRWFGPEIDLPLVHWKVPGALALTGGALVLTMIAGGCDLVWHSLFGLDETAWSFPHGMLGWGLGLTLLGLVACRLALGRHKPVAWYTLLLFGVMLIPVVGERVLGPIGSNYLPEIMGRTAALRVLVHEAAFQHTARIYLTWNLTRLNPLFVPLAALATGLGLGLVRQLDRRTWLFLAIVVVATLLEANGAHRSARFFGLQANPRAWMPVPFLPAALVLVVVVRAGLREPLAWALAGLACAACTVLIWGAEPLLILTGLVATPAGALLGKRLYRALARPDRRDVAVLLALAVAVPFLLGLLDLWLRTHTA
jgi:hypothetical protein